VTRPADMTLAQAKRYMRAAKAEGVAVRINPTTGEITFLPDIPKLSASVPVDDPESFESLDEYKAWRNGKDARRD